MEPLMMDWQMDGGRQCVVDCSCWVSSDEIDDDDDDDDDDVNDTHTRNKKQKETEPFTDQRENDLSIERTFISNQRQEKDAKRRRTK